MSMKQKNLCELMQNSAVGAIALHSFILGFYNVAKNKSHKRPFPKLQYLFYVLPIVYNESSMKTFLSSNQLYTALQNNNTIILELQERANKMSKQTFDSLNVAFSKKIISYNSKNKTIELLDGFKSKKIPCSSVQEPENSVKKIQDSAHKLGGIFAKRNVKQIQIDLNIRF